MLRKLSLIIDFYGFNVDLHDSEEGRASPKFEWLLEVFGARLREVRERLREVVRRGHSLTI